MLGVYVPDGCRTLKQPKPALRQLSFSRLRVLGVFIYDTACDHWGRKSSGRMAEDEYGGWQGESMTLLRGHWPVESREPKVVMSDVASSGAEPPATNQVANNDNVMLMITVSSLSEWVLSKCFLLPCGSIKTLLCKHLLCKPNHQERQIR